MQVYPKNRQKQSINEDNSLGSRLREFALKRFGGVASMQKELGKRVNFYQPYVDNRNKPGSEVLLELCQNGLNLNWLMTGNEEMLRGGINIKAYPVEGLSGRESHSSEGISSLAVAHIERWKEVDDSTLLVTTTEGLRILVVAEQVVQRA